MRTIRFHKTPNGAWISPGRLLSAVLSNESLSAVAHADLSPDEIAGALAMARITVERMLWAGAWRAFAGLLYSASGILLLIYPPIASKINAGIHGVLLGLLVISVVVSIMSIMKSCWISLRFGMKKISISAS